MIFKTIYSIYRPKFAKSVVYMLQATEYQVPAYLKWFWRTEDFSRVMYRKTLIRTRPARMLLLAMTIGLLVSYLSAATLAYIAWETGQSSLYFIATAIFLATPLGLAHLIVLPLELGRLFIIKPLHGRKISKSKKTLSRHPATKIAVAGSYGKTTVKEILLKVLAEGKKVAATQANMNVPISHARFAAKLNGDEEVLIIEYGEGAPGDVEKFVRITEPDIGIITGLAPAHLDKYKTLKAAGKDIFSLADSLSPEMVYVNSDSEAIKPFMKDGFITYDSEKVDGWKISDIKISIEGLSFKMQKGNKILKLNSRLLGRHLVGPLALAAALADKFGLNPRQIVAGVSNVKPFEHRMNQYHLKDAWIIDDTYNGNIDGMKAGLELLKELPAKRKIYVTPGLVDQGAETERVHLKLGEYIADSSPDLVVLMKHTVTAFIVEGLESNKFKGKVRIEEDPLNFYTNLEHFVAAGDLVLMQNDWPDNYN